MDHDILLLIVMQTFLLIAVSPLVTGTIRKTKAVWQGRVGASPLQPYRDLHKLFRKGTTTSKESSLLFLFIPYVCMATTIILAFMIPVVLAVPLWPLGDLIVVIYLLALYRFMMVLGGFEGGNPFGGMASRREMMISSIVEPTMLLSIFAMAAIFGTTDLFIISSSLASSGLEAIAPTLLLAAAAFFISLLAENSRVPFDNPSTHLELTMVHEGMLLEYSGRGLALMDLSAMVRLTAFAVILSNAFMPWGVALDTGWESLLIGLVAIIAKVMLIALAIAYVESRVAKMRLFRLPNLLTISFTISLLAVISYYLL